MWPWGSAATGRRLRASDDGVAEEPDVKESSRRQVAPPDIVRFSTSRFDFGDAPGRSVQDDLLCSANPARSSAATGPVASAYRPAAEGVKVENRGGWPRRVRSFAATSAKAPEGDSQSSHGETPVAAGGRFENMVAIRRRAPLTHATGSQGYAGAAPLHHGSFDSPLWGLQERHKHSEYSSNEGQLEAFLCG